MEHTWHHVYLSVVFDSVAQEEGCVFDLLFSSLHKRSVAETHVTRSGEKVRAHGFYLKSQEARR